jgi:multimeric flavodoxin WrbA
MSAGKIEKSPPEKRLLIVYHSQSGTTSRMADAVVKGAGNPDIENVDVRVRDALDATADDLRWADGFILGTPENFGYMSGALKVFLDRIYYACLDQVDGKPYALFVRAGNDGSGAISSITRILQGLSVRQVQETVLIAGDFDESRLDECETLGMAMAAGLEAGLF